MFSKLVSDFVYCFNLILNLILYVYLLNMSIICANKYQSGKRKLRFDCWIIWCPQLGQPSLTVFKTIFLVASQPSYCSLRLAIKFPSSVTQKLA